ncbi:MAG TPA: AsmA family protein [Candidatus Bathyarchaeia archaeon]|nr:AsmA family protein [Candidatus Bathyarchaeia archaeon]
MKFLKIIVIVLVVLVALLTLGLLIFVKTFDANKYKDQIGMAVGSALQTDVAIGEIQLKLSLKTGVALSVSDLSLADKGLLEGIGVRVEDVNVSVDILRLLRTKEIYVSQIDIREPLVRIDLAKRQQAGTTPAGAESSSAAKPTPPANSSNLSSSIIIQTLRVEGGEVVLAAGEGLPFAKEVHVTDISVAINGLVIQQGAGSSVTDPFTFQIGCAAFDNPKAVSIQGKGRLDIAQLQARFDDVTISSRLNDFSLGRLTETFPAAGEAKLTELGGTLNVLISQLIAGAQGLPVLSLKGSWKGGLLKTGYLNEPLRNIDFNIEYDGGNLVVRESTVELASGKVTFQGGIDDVLATQIFDFQLSGQSLALAALIPAFHPEISLAGAMNATVQVKGAGFDPLTVMQNTSGNATVKVADGKIAGFNALNFIFTKMSFLPGLAQDFKEALPQRYQSQLAQSDTTVQQVDVQTNLANGVATYTSTVVTDGASFTSKGTVDVKQQLTFEGSVSLDPELSAGLVHKVSSFSRLLNAQNQVVIPLAKYQGPVAAFRSLPDMEYLAKHLVVAQVKEEVKDQARKLLGDVLGIPQETAPQQGGSSDGTTPESKSEGSPKPDIIDNVFDSIFR